MTDDEFMPHTSQIGTPEMMYRLQIGLIYGRWAVRLFKDKRDFKIQLIIINY